MKLGQSHLCYSLNVFPCDPDLRSRISYIENKFNFIRESLGFSVGTPFALGFWSDAVFVGQMSNKKNLDLVKKFLLDNNFYVFTVNAFPYERFHSGRVKEKVYQPDWTTFERTDFTIRAADFLAELLPVNTPGSISTLPGGYKKALDYYPRENIEKRIAENLLRTAEHLALLKNKYGRKIILGIELEPDCLWENPAEFIEFHKKYIAGSTVAASHIGICYDTSHQQLNEGAPCSGLQLLLQNDIPIAKIQLSAALKTRGSDSSNIGALQPFADEVYLHQTRVFDNNGRIVESFADIPQNLKGISKAGNLVSHFHLPIFCGELGERLYSANSELLAVTEQLRGNPDICSNLEIETYTYGVLPATLSGGEIELNITREYQWFLEKFKL